MTYIGGDRNGVVVLSAGTPLEGLLGTLGTLTLLPRGRVIIPSVHDPI